MKLKGTICHDVQSKMKQESVSTLLFRFLYSNDDANLGLPAHMSQRCTRGPRDGPEMMKWKISSPSSFTTGTCARQR